MTINKTTKLTLLSVLIILIIVCLLGLPVIRVLSISNRKKPSEYYLSKQGIKNGFVISYTHSVNKGRVHDYYTCLDDDTLLLDNTVFVSYGAGIPEPEETPGAVFTVTPEGYKIDNLNRIVPHLVMAVGIIANHSIVFDCNNDFKSDANKEITMTDLFAPQTSLILKIKRVSYLNYILHKIN